MTRGGAVWTNSMRPHGCVADAWPRTMTVPALFQRLNPTFRVGRPHLSLNLRSSMPRKSRTSAANNFSKGQSCPSMTMRERSGPAWLTVRPNTRTKMPNSRLRRFRVTIGPLSFQVHSSLGLSAANRVTDKYGVCRTFVSAASSAGLRQLSKAQNNVRLRWPTFWRRPLPIRRQATSLDPPMSVKRRECVADRSFQSPARRNATNTIAIIAKVSRIGRCKNGRRPLLSKNAP